MDEHNPMIIKNGNVLLPSGDLVGCDVTVRNGRIRDVGPELEAETQIDAVGGYVLPGLIDLHTHAVHTVSVETGSLAEYAKIKASHGTTTFYPTLFSRPEENALQMERHRRETDELRQLPQVGGFRLESPYLAIASGGAASALASISPETNQMLLAAGDGHIKIWDVSPELAGASELIRQLSGEGIVCSIAHTRATTAQGLAAVDAGARLVTHLFDVFFYMPERTDPDPDIYAAGLVDYLLIEDRLTCEIIGDGTHVDPRLVEKAFRCKPPDKLAFVTDSGFGSGLPPGHYTAPGNWGNVVVRDLNDGVRLVDRDMMLAGSALTPIFGFRNVVRKFHKDIATASHVWSRNPARLLGLDKGEIGAGKDADLIVLDESLDLLYTIAAGEVVYERQ